MKRIFIPTKTGSDWQRILAQPTLHWQKGKSAMTAAAAWEDAGHSLPPEMIQFFGSSHDKDLVGLKLLAAFPEWEVALEGGVTASHTDVLALCQNDRGLCVIAVEAKVDEDFGPTLAQKRAEASSGQNDRLALLHGVLGIAQLGDAVRYQLHHRTVSAVLTARDFHAHVAVMVVHSFGGKESLRKEFEDFYRALEAQEVSPGLRVVPSVRDRRLFLGWCDGDRRFLGVDLPSAV